MLPLVILIETDSVPFSHLYPFTIAIGSARGLTDAHLVGDHAHKKHTTFDRCFKSPTRTIGTSLVGMYGSGRLDSPDNKSTTKIRVVVKGTRGGASE